MNCSASGKRCCKKVSAVSPGSSISCMGKYGGKEENSKGLIIITFIILVLRGRSFIYYYFVNSCDRSTIFLLKKLRTYSCMTRTFYSKFLFSTRAGRMKNETHVKVARD
jgi:hypothetical protein